MSKGRFKKATREAAKLRLALDGPAGGGKTFTAMRFAFALGGRVAVIDTERGSASKYAGESPDGIPFDFDVLELRSFSPTEYTEAIKEAAGLGYDVLLIDSLSHAWDGTGGALEQVDRKAADSRGNSFSAWKDVTPLHRKMVDAMLGADLHVIATMRTKTDFVLEPNQWGKMAPRRVGLAPVQRAGMEYEFDIYGSLDQDHNLTISKSRCRAVADARVQQPGAAFLRPVLLWLAGEPGHGPTTTESTPEVPAEPVPMSTGVQADTIDALRFSLNWTEAKLAESLRKKFGVGEVAALTSEQAEQVIAGLEAAAAKAKQKSAEQAAAQK